MKRLSATVADGRLTLPVGILRKGEDVAILIAEPEEPFEISPDEKAELLEAIAEADRGEVMDGWQLLAELKP